MNDKFFTTLQYCLPQHRLSRIAGWVANSRIGIIKNTFIQWFVKRYQVDMSEALVSEPTQFACFNDFFTRELKSNARPIATGDTTIVYPADGCISQSGNIENGRIFQAKGQDYTALELLGGDESLASTFEGGKFATVYLSPKDYHRVHMPLTGTLQQMTVIPGDLFSVNDATARGVPRLFSRNERAVAVFETQAGPMAIVLVGAMIVAGIETVWAGSVAPLKPRITTHHYGEHTKNTITLQKGDEMGRFKLGSTAIILFAKDHIQWSEDCRAGSQTRMGESAGKIIKS